MRRAVALIAAAALVGCGASGDEDHAARVAPAPPGAVQPTEVKRELAGGFQSGLEALAVLAQPGDDGVALGQDVPAGTLTAIRCPSAERCAVSWRTVGGKGRTVQYRIRAFQRGCFTAAADPELPDPYDATTGSHTANPLNTVVGTRCA